MNFVECKSKLILLYDIIYDTKFGRIVIWGTIGVALLILTHGIITMLK